MTEQERRILSEYLGVPNWQTEFPIPEQFQAYLDACTREEHVIPTPNGTTKLWVFMPKKRSESKAAFLYFNGAAYCYPHADIHWCFCARIAAELGIPVVDGLYTLISVAPYGLFVTQVCRDNGLNYYYGPRTITYTGCVLF